MQTRKIVVNCKAIILTIIYVPVEFLLQQQVIANSERREVVHAIAIYVNNTHPERINRLIEGSLYISSPEGG